MQLFDSGPVHVLVDSHHRHIFDAVFYILYMLSMIIYIIDNMYNIYTVEYRIKYRYMSEAYIFDAVFYILYMLTMITVIIVNMYNMYSINNYPSQSKCLVYQLDII